MKNEKHEYEGRQAGVETIPRVFFCYANILRGK